MLTVIPGPRLRRVDWVADLVVELRRSREPRWLLGRTVIAGVDELTLPALARDSWPARLDAPAGLWLLEDGCDLLVSLGREWRRLTPRGGGVEPASRVLGARTEPPAPDTTDAAPGLVVATAADGWSRIVAELDGPNSPEGIV